jgi:hypothetical protein
MRVHVDPTGRNQETGCVDLAAGGAELAADVYDALALDCEIAGKTRRTGAICA